MSKVIVIVVTYNGSHWIKNCFGSLMNSTHPLTVLAIDNASTDGTPDIIRSNYPTVEVIETGENLGFGKANNIGLKRVLNENADFAFLLNQDAWIESNTIAALVEQSKLHPEFGIISPMHLTANKTEIEKTLLTFITNHTLTNSKLVEDMYFNRVKQIYDTNYINAAAWLLPRNTLEIVGGFDPIFFHYGEDDNYMHRVHFHGLRIGICPLVTVVHDTISTININLNTQRSNYKSLLVECTNINVEINLNQRLKYYSRAAFLKRVRFKSNASNYYRDLYTFLHDKLDDILNSRKQNSKKYKSWID